MCRWPVWIPDQKFHASCGRCLHCRRKRSADWSLRLIHERESFKGNVTFLTLTYNEENVGNYELKHADIQKYVKRLRKRLDKTEKIKYFVCGEYGSKHHRPHYHMILFGFSPKQYIERFELKKISDIPKTGFATWYDPLWKNTKTGESMGHVVVGYDTSDMAIAYTTGYLSKKLGGKSYYEDELCIKAPYNIASHGVGRDFASTDTNISIDLAISLHGYKRAVPRYYRKLLGLTQEDYKSMIKEKEQNELAMAQDAGVNVCIPDGSQGNRKVSTADALDLSRPWRKNHKEAMKFAGVEQPIAFWVYLQNKREIHNKILQTKVNINNKGVL